MRHLKFGAFGVVLVWVASVTLVYAVAVFTIIFVGNADFYGRLTQTQIAPGVSRPKAAPSDGITVRVVLHRLMPDENVIEASLQLIAEGKAADGIRNSPGTVTAVLRDGSIQSPLDHRVLLKGAPQVSGTESVSSLAAESDRFMVPAFVSVGGFPFDDVMIRPIVLVSRDGANTDDFKLEVQKALPGRLMELNYKSGLEVRLSRSPTEKILVMAASAMFLFLTVLLAHSLVSSAKGMSAPQEFLAIGGFILSAAGFRTLLGVSRTAGASALEIGVIGIPLIFLSCAVGFSYFRGRKVSRQEK